MTYQYKEYMKKEKVLTFEEEIAIHDEMCREIGSDRTLWSFIMNQSQSLSSMLQYERNGL